MTGLSPVKQALLQQRRMKTRIEELERERREPIAVVGLGCRFPGGAVDAPSFWRLLREGTNAISEIPSDRFDLASCYDPDVESPGKIATRYGGFLPDIDRFDARRFGISPREAAMMDPQQRLLLEVTWEALEHAGCAPDRVAGMPMGVFLGLCTNDYLQRYAQRGLFADIDPYLATGSAHSVASGRISYLLGLHGPSLTLDTACSSSLVAIHTACESIRSGSCEMALAGGAGVLLSLEIFVSLSKARMLAPDGRCKAFDASANGFVRSEGCGVVVLKRLSAAVRDGDRILAVVRGSACNQDGRSNGLTAPNGPAQQAVIRAALANAGVEPSSIGYLEAHGTGTVLGDPIEVESLAAVLGQGRRPDQALVLGSVKTNLGHLEAAAGVAGFIKTVLVLHHRAIPANLHFQRPNPHIGWDACPFVRVPTGLTQWETAPRLAGVSAFGFSGTNAHVVLEEAPASSVADSAVKERPLHVLALSGNSDEALRAAAWDLARHVDAGATSLADLCYSVNTGREPLSHRALVAASQPAELRACLAALGEGRRDGAVASGVVEDGVEPRLLFLFPAAGAVPPGAAGSLGETSQVFQAALVECEEALRGELGGDWLTRCWLKEGTTDRAAVAGSAFALQYATALLWRSWGIEPSAVAGEGVGEYVAGVVAGALGMQEALRLAAGNSGQPGRLPSPAPAVGPCAVPFFSGAAGRRATTAELADAGRWASIRAEGTSVQAAVAAAVAEGFDLVLDIGTSSGGSGAAVTDMPRRVSSFETGRDAWDSIAAALGRLHAAGARVDWRAFDRGRQRVRVDVPASPRVRQRYWFPERAAAGRAEGQSAWEFVTRQAARQARQAPIDLDLSRFGELWAELNRFTSAAVARAVIELGVFPEVGSRRTLEGAMSAGQVLPMYGRLLSLWFDRLVREGCLDRLGETFEATEALERMAAAGSESPGPACDRVPILRDYLVRCRAHAAAIVSGRQTPLETLFPGGSYETADFFYRDWSLARYHNAILASIAEALRETSAGDPIRVLEVGGGSGGTTMSLLPAFDPACTDYWFTDVSGSFFGRAERQLADFPFVHCHRLDVDRDPAEQGIPTGQFDLVVAANALHAAKDLGKAIDYVRSLLAPGGLLLLYEVTTHLDWFEISVALIEGWQHHEDRLRAETPLLNVQQWSQALGARGFERVASFPEAGSPAGVLGHCILVAALPAEPQPARVPIPVVSRGRAERAETQPAARSAGGAGGPAIRERLAELTPTERLAAIQQLVQREVARVMRLPAEAAPPGVNDRLMHVGVDSLMAVELKAGLVRQLDGAVDLPSTLIFDFPTIAAMVPHILQSLGFADEPTRQAAEAAPRPAASAEVTPTAIAEMTDAEVEALLAARLKGLSK
jgi:acyl transferase domain-containing protein/SAM-dependent methyltransferase